MLWETWAWVVRDEETIRKTTSPISDQKSKCDLSITCYQRCQQAQQSWYLLVQIEQPFQQQCSNDGIQSKTSFFYQTLARSLQTKSILRECKKSYQSSYQSCQWNSDNYQSHSIRSCSIKLKILVCFNEVIMTPHLKEYNIINNNNIIVYCYCCFITFYLLYSKIWWPEYTIRSNVYCRYFDWCRWQSAPKCSHEHLPPTNMAWVWFPEGRTGGSPARFTNLTNRGSRFTDIQKLFVFPNSENKKVRYSF